MSKIANAGFIVAIVDGRGTGFKGRAFRAVVSRQLGKLEVEDQIAAAKYLGSLPFVDAKRVAIWGWSYGGYMAAKVIEANPKEISLGMSVAPVIDWRYYGMWAASLTSFVFLCAAQIPFIRSVL